MKGPFKRIALFTAGFILLNIGATLYFYKKSVAGLNLTRNEEQFRAEATDHIPILFLGNSRSTNGMVRDTIDGMVMFANGGETSLQTYFKFKHLVEAEGKKVDTVVFAADLMGISSPRPTHNLNSYYWKDYVNYLEVGQVENDLETYLSVYVKSHLFPWYEYPYIRLKLSCNEVVGRDKSIIEAYKSGDVAQKKVQTDIWVENLLRQNDNYSKSSLYYLEKSLELCKKHHIHPVFVKYPVTLPFKQSAFELMERDNIPWQRADSILAAHQNEITLLDYEDYYDEHQEYFKDMHHLSTQGKVLFTEVLRERMGWRYKTTLK